MEADEISGMFPWWAVASDTDPTAPRKRALAWLDGPYARVTATTRYVISHQIETLFDLFRRSIDQHGIDAWDTPVEFEAWLRGLLQGCAMAIEADG